MISELMITTISMISALIVLFLCWGLLAIKMFWNCDLIMIFTMHVIVFKWDESNTQGSTQNLHNCDNLTKMVEMVITGINMVLNWHGWVLVLNKYLIREFYIKMLKLTLASMAVGFAVSFFNTYSYKFILR